MCKRNFSCETEGVLGNISGQAKINNQKAGQRNSDFSNHNTRRSGKVEQAHINRIRIKGNKDAMP